MVPYTNSRYGISDSHVHVLTTSNGINLVKIQPNLLGEGGGGHDALVMVQGNYGSKGCETVVRCLTI